MKTYPSSRKNSLPASVHRPAPGKKGQQGKPSRHIVEVLETRIAPAATLGVTKVAVFAPGGDLNSNGIFDPGDTILYTVTLTNSGTVDLTGVTMNDILDGNLTQGAVNASPLAFDDTYSAVANTLLEVGVTHGAFPAAQVAGNVLSNDTEFLSDTFTLKSFEATSANGGTVAMNANGTFTYLPAAGFTGADTFHYTITDKGFDGVLGNADDLTSIGTVKITVGAQKVWYVDNAYNPVTGGASDGRSTHPFTSLTGATELNGASGNGDVDGAGDIIFVHTGSGNYTGGLNLETNETLQGAGDALTISGFNLVAAGTRPIIVNGSGNGLTLGSGNTLHGFNLGTISGTAITGSGIGTLTIDNININTTGVGLDLTTGTIAGTGFGSTVAKSLNLVGLGGTLHLGGGSLTNSGATDALHIQTGAASIDFSGTITQSSGAGNSVDISGKSGGTVALSGLVADNGGGILLSSNTGATINFTGGVVASTGANKAFSATGGGTVTVTGTTNTLTTTTGTALEVQNTTIGASGFTFKSISSNGAANGIILNNTGGGFLAVTGDGVTDASVTTKGQVTAKGGGGTVGITSGGTIVNSTGAGVSLTNTGVVTLQNMQITTGNDGNGTISDNQHDGIFASTVAGLILDNVKVTGFADNYGLHGTNVTGLSMQHVEIGNNATTVGVEGVDIWNVRLDNLIGNASVLNSTFHDSRENIFAVIETGSTITNLTVTNAEFRDTAQTSPGNDGLHLETNNTSQLSATVTNSTFLRNRSGGFFYAANGSSGGGTLTINNNSFEQTQGTELAIAHQGLGKTVHFSVHNNLIRQQAFTAGASSGVAVSFLVGGLSNASTVLEGTFAGNQIGNSAQLNSASLVGAAVVFQQSGAGTLTTLIDSNKVRQVKQDDALWIISTNSTGVINATITNNDLRTGSDSTQNNLSLSGVDLTAGTLGTDTGTLNVNFGSGNTAFVGANNYFGIDAVTSAGNPTIALQGYAGPAGTPANQNATSIQTFLAGRATTVLGTPGSPALSSVGAGTIKGFVGTVPLPSTNLLFVPGEITTTPPPANDTPVVVVTTPPDTTTTPAAPVVTAPVIVDDGVLSQAELDSLVQAAIARWEATGLTPAQDALLHSISFSVADLPGWTLGQASAGHVTLDLSAAGNSWFIDATPNDDSEFTGTGTQLAAKTDGAAAGRIDALTTIVHELGHQLGLDDTFSDGQAANLMYGFIHQGERRLPGLHQADGATPHLAAGGLDFAIGPVNIGALPVGKSVAVQFKATINSNITANSVSNTAVGHSTETGDVNSNTVVTTVDLPNVTVDVSTPNMNENSGGAFTYTFHRTGLNDFARVVNFSLTGTATAGTDYTVTGATSLAGGVGTVTFAAGSDTATITVTPTGDTTVELDETAIVTVTPGSGYDVTAPSVATGTIKNDDASVVSITGASVTEGDSGTKNLGFTINLTNPVDVDTTVTFNTADGTAKTGNSDYVGQTNVTVTIPAGQTSVTKNVVINGDTTVEADETFTGTISGLNASGRSVTLGTATATGTITNDDTATVSITGATTAEGNAGTKNLDFTIALSKPSDVDTTVTFNTADGTATAGSDYVGQSNVTVTILAGQTSVTKSVVINGDATVENDETFTATISALNNNGRAGVTLGTATATGTIQNDDTATVSISSPTVTEGNSGLTNLNFNISLTNPVDVDTTVTFNTADGTATSASGDYDALTNVTVTIPAGQTSVSKTVSVHGDNLVELTETLTATISNLSAGGRTGVTLGTATGTGTITNDDTANITISGGSVAEGNSGTSNLPFTINLSNPVDTDIIVVFSTNATGTATPGTDFVAQSNVAITIPAGQTTVTKNVVVNGDTSAEADETVGAVLGIQNNGGRNASVTTSSATGTILNDDTEISVSVSPSVVFEDGISNLVYTFTRAGVTTGALTVNFSVAGTADSADFTHSGDTTFGATAGTVTFAPGATTATVTIDPTADSTVELDENLTLAVTAGTGYNLAASNTSATGTILNDDATVTVSVSPASVAEDGPGVLTYTFTRVGYTGNSLPVNVNLSGTAGLTGDYSATGFTSFNTSTGAAVVTFSGESSTAIVTISPTDDTTGEPDETVVFTLGAGSGYGLGAQTVATGTIINDDTAVSVSLAPASVNENSATGHVYTFTRTGDTSTALTVNFGVGGTALFTSDYTASGASAFTASTGSVVIPIGQSSVNVTLVPVNDVLVEGDETITLNVAAGSGYSPAGSPATGTILDNDTATITYSSATSTVGEGAGNDALSFTLNITADGTGTAALASDVTFNVTKTGGTALDAGTDYTLPGGPITFAAGAVNGATKTAGLAITNDALVEGNETAILGLTMGASTAGGKVTIGAANSHTTTITDNDTATITYSAATSSVNEGAGNDALGFVLTITADGTGTPMLTKDVTFNVTTVAGGTATGGGTDYTLPGTVTFAANALSGATQSANLGIVNDLFVEGSETATLGLTLGTDGTGGQVTIGAANAHTTTITDNDTATITFLGAATNTVSEGAGTDTLSFVLNFTTNGTGTAMLAKAVTFNVTTAAGGTATDGVDYVLGGTGLSFSAGSVAGAQRQLTYTLTDDQLVEGAETANYALTLGTDGTGGQVTIGAANAHTTTITDNDSATIVYSAATSTVGEGAGNDVLSFTLNITATGTGTPALASDVTFNVTKTGGTASDAGVDYTLPGLVTFTAGSGQGATKTANLAIVNDAHVEGSETAILGLAMGASNAGGKVTIGGANAHTTTITDNDTAVFSWVTPGSTSSDEGVGTVDRLAKIVITANGTGPAVLDRDVTFNIGQFGLSATQGVDFTAPTTLTFNAGAADGSTKALTITIVNDAIVESMEDAQFMLFGIASDGTGGQASISPTGSSTGLTITDNDTASFSYVAATSNGSEAAKSGSFDIQLSINANGTGTPMLGEDLKAVPGIGFGGTATVNADFSPSISATFPAGSTAGTIKTATVTIVDDALVEGNETIVLNGLTSVGPGAGSVVPTAGTHTMTIADNDVNLNISKTDNVSTAIPGTQVTYIITANNAGLTVATGATVTDLFPANLTNVSWSVIGITSGSNSAHVDGGAGHSGNLNDTVTLATGGTITYRVTGIVAPDATGTLSNTATIAAPTGFTDQTPGNDSATDTDTLVPTGDLSITKTDGKATLVPGTDNTYTIVVSNPGPSNVVGAHVDDLFPAGFLNPTFTAAGSAGTVFTASGGGDLHDTVNIPAGGSITYTVTGHVGSGLLGNFANTATVTAPNGFTDNGESNNNTATDTDTLTPQADLAILKTGPATIVAGTDITYHITLTNNGPSDALNVQANDLLPAGTTLVSFTQTGGPAAGGTLITGGTMTFDLVAHVAPNIVAGTILMNTAALNTTTPDLTLENNTSTVLTTVTTSADLIVTKTAPAQFIVGQDTTYTITVTNQGPSYALNVHLADVLPAGMTFGSISTDLGNANFDGTTMTVDDASLADGAVMHITVHATPQGGIGGTSITNTATVTSTTADPNGNNNSASATSFVAGTDLTLTKDNGGSTPLVPGDTVTYTLHYANNGFVTATGVVITETLPAGTTFLSADNPGWTQVGATNQYTHPVADLAVGAAGTLPFVVHVKSAVAAGLETIDNTAIIADNGASGPDIHPADNTGTDSDVLHAQPDLSINLAGSPQTVVRGGGVVYTINYANVGNQDATGVVLTQTLPPNTTFDPIHSGSWSFVGNNTYQHTVGELDVAAGAQTIDFAVTLNTSIPAGYNKVSTTSTIDDDHANGADPVTANNSATALTTIYQGIYAVSTGIALPRKGPAATVRVFDIATGAEFTLQPYGATYKQSIRIATGDINGDGYDDIITSTITGNGQVRVFDGKTMQRMGGVFAEDIAAFPEKGARGAYVASGDVNGDGHDDIIVGSGYRAGGDAIVRVFNGLNAQVLNTSTPFGTKFHGGVRVAVGDVNGDGVADIIAGQGFGGNEVKVTTLVDRRESLSESHVSIAKPPETVLRDFTVGGSHYKGGVWVGAGDINNDGHSDIIVGRDRGDTVIETFSGLNGDLLSTITPFGTRYKLGVRVAAADINLDGIADIIAGSGGRNNSTVKIFDGTTSMEIPALTFQAFPAAPTGALFVAGTSPVPFIRSYQQPV